MLASSSRRPCNHNCCPQGRTPPREATARRHATQPQVQGTVDGETAWSHHGKAANNSSPAGSRQAAGIRQTTAAEVQLPADQPPSTSRLQHATVRSCAVNCKLPCTKQPVACFGLLLHALPTRCCVTDKCPYCLCCSLKAHTSPDSPVPHAKHLHLQGTHALCYSVKSSAHSPTNIQRPLAGNISKKQPLHRCRVECLLTNCGSDATVGPLFCISIPSGAQECHTRGQDRPVSAARARGKSTMKQW